MSCLYTRVPSTARAPWCGKDGTEGPTARETIRYVSSGATIVVVDDDPRVRALLRDCFEGESWQVFEASDGDELFARLEAHAVDLVTLDIALGDENGLDLVRELRRTSDVGIVMVTGKGELIDTVVGLELGADDYIGKPFELRELVARVRSVLRRYGRGRGAYTSSSPGSRGPEIAFGDWRLYPEARLLTDTDGEPIELSGSEFDLLELFLANPHRALSRDLILEGLKGRERDPSDRTVDNLVAQLRKKLDRPDRPRLINTVRGVGYAFSGDVEYR